MFYLLFSFQLWPCKAQCFQSEWHTLPELHFSTKKWSTFYRKGYHSTKNWRKKVVCLRCSWSLFCSSNEVGRHCSSRRCTCSFSSTFFFGSVCWIICLWSHHGIHGCYCGHLCMSDLGSFVLLLIQEFVLTFWQDTLPYLFEFMNIWIIWLFMFMPL